MAVHRIRRGFPQAFSSQKEIHINIKADGNSWILEYRDNGLSAVDDAGFSDGEGGLFLTESLCAQLDGEKVFPGSREADSGFVLGFRFSSELLLLPE